jgi:hypothetical protein
MVGKPIGTHENHRHVVRIAFTQQWVIVNVDFAKGGSKFGQQGRNGRFSIIAEVAAFTRVEGDYAGSSNANTPVFRAAVEVPPAVFLQEAVLHKHRDRVKDGFTLLRRIAADELEERVEVERIATELIECGEDSPVNWVHYFARLSVEIVRV